MEIFKEFVKKHPLLTVLILAMAVRMVSVIFSQGFIQSDDYYDTVEVSYDWLRGGLWGDDGFLRWKEHSATTIVRFPLYTLFLYFIMKIHLLLGISALDQMMYTIRFIHALLSLLPIWAVYKLTEKYTGGYKWAFWASLLAAFHFAMPFLGVRNLIEMVGGDFWMVAIFFLYRYLDRREDKWLYWAGLFSGLAWMMRFQLAFAIIPVPLVLWYEARRIRPAFHYSLAVAIMLLIAAVADKFLLGYWAASTINNLGLNTGQGAIYKTIDFMYPIVILGFFIPPFSFIMVYLSWQKEFWIRHRLLIVSTLFFILAHSLHPNQQERFMIPIVPAIMFWIAMAVWYRYKNRGYILLKRRSWRVAVISFTLAVNLLLLIPFTVGYGHKGLIEPLIWYQRMDNKPRVMFLQPEIYRWVPEQYGGYERMPRAFIRKWSELETLPDYLKEKDAFGYFVLYPSDDGDLDIYVDSITTRYGKLEPVRIFEPSFYDRMFHFLNPGHYPTFKAYVYEPG